MICCKELNLSYEEVKYIIPYNTLLLMYYSLNEQFNELDKDTEKKTKFKKVTQDKFGFPKI